MAETREEYRWRMAELAANLATDGDRRDPRWRPTFDEMNAKMLADDEDGA